ncbi:uncharacterized protein LOC119527819 [Choloepus didactylus]|uniref:uncharacterized protein LOC119527819 n=1 Tax=Choloepus didactylus TaxID=27675 RepID=UPI00189CD7B1|nr:uncharacterized protein LOC119527819 [Choloepus didactylus]
MKERKLGKRAPSAGSSPARSSPEPDSPSPAALSCRRHLAWFVPGLGPCLLSYGSCWHLELPSPSACTCNPGSQVVPLPPGLRGPAWAVRNAVFGPCMMDPERKGLSPSCRESGPSRSSEPPAQAPVPALVRVPWCALPGSEPKATRAGTGTRETALDALIPEVRSVLSLPAPPWHWEGWGGAGAWAETQLPARRWGLAPPGQGKGAKAGSSCQAARSASATTDPGASILSRGTVLWRKGVQCEVGRVPERF